MSDARPVLAVDVDGVLNALSTGPRPPDGWRDATVKGFRIRHNPDHGRQLLAVAAGTGAELAWCTTWEDDANEHIAPLVGLPRLPVVPMEPGFAANDVLARAGFPLRHKFSAHPSVGEVKAAAMAAWARDRPFCWLDDEPDAAMRLTHHPVPHLVIRVDGRAGLGDHHLRKASGWLAENTRREEAP